MELDAEKGAFRVNFEWIITAFHHPRNGVFQLLSLGFCCLGPWIRRKYKRQHPELKNTAKGNSARKVLFFLIVWSIQLTMKTFFFQIPRSDIADTQSQVCWKKGLGSLPNLYRYTFHLHVHVLHVPKPSSFLCSYIWNFCAVLVFFCAFPCPFSFLPELLLVADSKISRV